MAKNSNSENPSVNIIGAGTVIEGDITTNGDMRIDGSLTGSINVKGKLVVGPSGTIEGEIICQNADISGTIKGKIGVAELLALKSSSKLTGDIITNKIAIEPGAAFSGSCSMGGVIKDIKGERTEKAELSEKTA
ncbi:MAG: polymer-forming cytoskeletal protein [Bacteroidetes bacterium]|nr:polymer-forming cytoskeletal protein [Bacteroidia bacterium]MBN8695118.1 polymer-forming cytoskeletal protein [Bacteroidota bacterium]